MRRETGIAYSAGFGPAGYPSVICGECGQAVEVLTKIHIAKHGLTQQEYLRRYPDHCYLHMWPDLPNFKNQEKYRKWRERLGVTETETAQETR